MGLHCCQLFFDAGRVLKESELKKSNSTCIYKRKPAGTKELCAKDAESVAVLSERQILKVTSIDHRRKKKYNAKFSKKAYLV